MDAEQLNNARARLHSFAINHAAFRVRYEEGEDGCTLIFDTLGGSQQFTETFTGGIEVAQECLELGEGLVLEENDDTRGKRKLRVRQKNLRELQAMKMWEGYTCIEVSGDSRRESGAEYSSLWLPDHSEANVRRMADDIKAGRLVGQVI